MPKQIHGRTDLNVISDILALRNDWSNGRNDETRSLFRRLHAEAADRGMGWPKYDETEEQWRERCGWAE